MLGVNKSLLGSQRLVFPSQKLCDGYLSVLWQNSKSHGVQHMAGCNGARLHVTCINVASYVLHLGSVQTLGHPVL